ncbi:hypothetical protein Q6247_25805, partial [Klebsiella pneumoniae]
FKQGQAKLFSIVSSSDPLSQAGTTDLREWISYLVGFFFLDGTVRCMILLRAFMILYKFLDRGLSVFKHTFSDFIVSNELNLNCVTPVISFVRGW